MKVGDLVRFWDYETGDGFVPGVIVEMVTHKYSSVSGDEVPSLLIAYKGTLQTVPVDAEWVPEVISEY